MVRRVRRARLGLMCRKAQRYCKKHSADIITSVIYLRIYHFGYAKDLRLNMSEWQMNMPG